MDNYVVIRIKEREFRDNSFQVEISIRENKDEQEEHKRVTFVNPYSEKTESLLEWHFERYINRPYDDNRAKDAINAIEQYGKELFQQLFTGDLEHRFRLLLQQYRPENIIIEVIGEEPLFQAIYWESLRAPWQPHPLVASGTLFLRKNTRGSDIKATVKQSPTINLLIVTARPNEENDVAYRAIQRPLVDLLEKTEANVRVHILRPGTFEALVRHLDDHAGHYHIIHFDLHGGLLDYAGYKHFHSAVEQLPGGNNLYGGYFGLKELNEVDFGDGKKSFLFFESEERGVAVPVDAGQLADLLEHKHIPICVLNACQSAKQDGTGSSTSLGSILVKKGIQLVVAMRYSVSVTAAEVMMGELYHHLYQQKPPEHCIARSRQQLYRMKKRKALYNYNIELEDWLLPIVYQNGKPDLNLRAYTLEEEERVVAQRTLPEEVQQHLPYGFKGRDLDILKIEKDLLLRSNILLLQGMGGAGKTTLLKYLCQWWMRTGFVERVFYFGYDVRAYTLTEILYYIAQRIYPDTEYRLFMAKKPSVQEDNIVRALKNNRYALILDNTESITGEKLAIPNTLPEAERQALKKFLERLKKGRTHVLIGSRSGEAWLKQGTFDNHVYLLKGLDPESATDFAQCILFSIQKPLEAVVADPHFDQLMKLLGGYPLALKAILPNLRRETPEEILVKLGEGNIELDKGNAQERTESIIKCIEYTHSNLSEEAQQLLLCLAPFQTIVNLNSNVIAQYFERLKKEERFQTLPFAKLEVVIEEAVQNGLMQEGYPGTYLHLMILQPAFTYFLKNKLKDDFELLQSLQTAFIDYYRTLGDSFHKLLNSIEDDNRKFGLFYTDIEYENLYQALLLMLDREETIMDVYQPLNKYLEIKQFREKQLLLAEIVCGRVEQYKQESFTPEMDLEFLNSKLKLAVIFQDLNKPYEAQKVYEDILAYWDSKSSSFVGWSKAVIYQNLGNVFFDQGMNDESEMYHQKALGAFVKNDDLLGQGRVNQNLGNVARRRRKFSVALEYYEKALSIYVQLKDEFRQARVLNNLGNLVSDQQNYKAAIEYYNRALELFKKYGVEYYLGGIYQNLGTMKSFENDFKNAKEYVWMALNIYVKHGDLLGQGNCFMNLGGFYDAEKEHSMAEEYYEKALDIYIQLDIKLGQGDIYYNLGALRCTQGDLTLSREYLDKALTIYTQLEDAFNQAKVHKLLALIVWELQEHTDAEYHFEKCLNILQLFPSDNEFSKGVLENVHSFVKQTNNKTFGQSMFEKALPLFEGEEREELLKLLDEINQLDSPAQE